MCKMSTKTCIYLLLLVISTFEEIQAFSSITCENSDLTIECTEGTTIKVTYANYGRLSPIHCDDGQHVIDLNCTSETSLQMVKDRCNSERICIISAHNRVFGDPCVNTIKYLEVRHECIAAPGTPLAVSSDETKTSVACENNELNIGCNEGEVLSIISANYGRTSKTICDDGHNVRNLNCKASITESIVKSRCDSKRSCSVGALNTVFGDPCVHTIKYLEVKYKCLAKGTLAPPVVTPATTTEPSIARLNSGPMVEYSQYKTAIACEHNNVHIDNRINIECREGELIHIIRANYGRIAHKICNKGNVTKWLNNCMSAKSFWIVDTRCNSKRTCSIEASNNLFGDPCPGTEKYLEIHYICAPTQAQHTCGCVDFMDVRFGEEKMPNIF